MANRPLKRLPASALEAAGRALPTHADGVKLYAAVDRRASVARRALQLTAGLLLLVGLLGLSTALIAEVREDVVHAANEDASIPERRVTKQAAGLPVANLTLLDPASVETPDHRRSGDRVTFTQPASLRLEPGEAIDPGPITLDGGAQLDPGPASQATGEQITCPAGCQLQWDEHNLSVPPNASILPPGNRGPFDGPIESGSPIELAPGTRLDLGPIYFPSGTQLPIGPGARAQLPPLPGDLTPTPDASTLLLPAGTVLHRAPGGNTTGEDLDEMLNGTRSRTPQSLPTSIERPDIQITRAPEQVEKGQPFQVEGQVTGPQGGPLADHPVSLFANATKRAPGFPIATQPASTNRSGGFTAQALIPEDRPTRSYHLLARADARPGHEPPLGSAWTDPLVNVTGTSNLELSIADPVGVRVPLALQARLTDAYGAAIPNQTVRFQVENLDEAPKARTGADGRVLAILGQGLPYPGNYTVEASFPGTEAISDSHARDHVKAIQARIETNATIQAPRGEPVTLEGRVVAEQGDPGRVRVRAHYNGNLSTYTNTTPEGDFELELPVPGWLAPGTHPVTLEANAVDARHRTVLQATAGLVVDAPRLSPQPVGARVPLPVTVRLDDGRPQPGVLLQAGLEGQPVSRTVTDEKGQARLELPVVERGTRVVRIETQAGDPFREDRTRVPVEGGRLDVQASLSAVPGDQTDGTVRLSVRNSPLTGVDVRLVGPGFVERSRTGSNGTAEFALDVPAGTPPGRLQANLSLPSYGLDVPVPVQVLAVPELDIQWLEDGRDGAPVQLRVQARDRGDPLEGVPVVARATGAFQARDRAHTQANGTALLTLHRPDDAEGSATVSVQTLSTPRTAATSHVATTQVSSRPVPWGWIAGALGVLGLAGTVALRRQANPEEPAHPETRRPTLALTVEPQSDGFPPVWHPGEPLALAVQLTDARGHPISNATVELDGPPGVRSVELDAQGRAHVRLPAHERGTHTYRARFEGNDDHEEVETLLDLRIVQYREEIDREYRDLRDEAYRAGYVNPDATPRELADALGPPAPELARLFERCDYSPRRVEREDYERFMRAKDALTSDGLDA